MIKKCNKCNQHKPFGDFHNSLHGKYGKHGTCKECMKLSYIKDKHAKMLNGRSIQQWLTDEVEKLNIGVDICSADDSFSIYVDGGYKVFSFSKTGTVYTYGAFIEATDAIKVIELSRDYFDMLKFNKKG